MERTVISFWVSVPVLSVQITLVDPKVSTAESFLIRALRFAMRCVPIAKASVTVGNKPSGTKATIIPSARMRLFTSGVEDIVKAIIKKTTPKPSAIKVMILVICSISFCNGLRSSPIC